MKPQKYHPDTVLNFGKYKGYRVSEAPANYVAWLKENTKHTFKKGKRTDKKKELPSTKIENNFRITCMNLGRKLIYNNVEIPF